MKACPRCAQPGGFHNAGCGTLCIPAEWRMGLRTHTHDRIVIDWDDGANWHVTEFYLGDKPTPGWAQ